MISCWKDTVRCRCCLFGWACSFTWLSLLISSHLKDNVNTGVLLQLIHSGALWPIEEYVLWKNKGVSDWCLPTAYSDRPELILIERHNISYVFHCQQGQDRISLPLPGHAVVVDCSMGWITFLMGITKREREGYRSCFDIHFNCVQNIAPSWPSPPTHPSLLVKPAQLLTRISTFPTTILIALLLYSLFTSCNHPNSIFSHPTKLNNSLPPPPNKIRLPLWLLFLFYLDHH